MSTEPRDTDVLVVGAGPTGQMMASWLVAGGARVRLVDKAPVRSDKTRALVVHARSLELFQKMGLADELVARGKQAVHLNGFIEGRKVLDVDLGDIGADDTPYPYLLFVSQAETERVLDQHLTRLGVTVERPVELVDYVEEAGGVRARLSRDGVEEIVRARYLVGCDGAHSAVRKTAGLRFEGAPYLQDFVLADVDVAWDTPGGQLYFFFGKSGVLVFFPLPGASTFRIIASRVHDTGAEEPTLAEIQALADAMCPFPVELKNPTWITRFRLHHRGVDRYRKGRVFVAGDAAHIHSPAGGQGMNTGLQDAANLAWKLALVLQGRAPDALLDSYHDERYPVGRLLLRFTDRLFSGVATSNPLLITLRNRLLPLVAPKVLERRWLRARAFRFVSQLGIKYPKSPVVGESRKDADDRFLTGPGPGLRVPDGPLVTASDGREATLFSQLTGVAHHLLVFGGVDAGDPAPLHALAERVVAPRRAWMKGHVILGRRPDAPADDALVDASGIVHQRYGLRGPALYLVRPDGHVAWRAPSLDVAALEAHLRWLFGAG